MRTGCSAICLCPAPGIADISHFNRSRSVQFNTETHGCSPCHIEHTPITVHKRYCFSTPNICLRQSHSCPCDTSSFIGTVFKVSMISFRSFFPMTDSSLRCIDISFRNNNSVTGTIFQIKIICPVTLRAKVYITGILAYHLQYH